MSLIVAAGTLGFASAYAQDTGPTDQIQTNPPPPAQVQEYENTAPQTNPPPEGYTAPEQTPPPPPPLPPNQEYTTPEQAQANPPANEEDNREHLYHAGEVSIDAFGAGMLHSFVNRSGSFSRRSTMWGGGAGANFFFTKYIGVGGEFMAVGSKYANTPIGNLTALGNVIFRYPIGKTGLAPYAFGGAGYQFSGINQFVGGGGFGLEFRPVKHIGLFVDAEWLAAHKTSGFGVGRAGIRFSF